MFEYIQQLERENVELKNSIREKYYQKVIELFEEFPGDKETKLKYLQLSIDGEV